jgi:hypothetical protein
MKWWLLVTVLFGFVACTGMRAGLTLAGRLLARGAPPAAGQIYTVSQVQAGLLQNPAAWTDRTVWLRGTAMDFPCPPGFSTCGPQTVLVGDGPNPPVFAQLPVVVQQSKDLARFLRRIPWLDTLLPQAPSLRWNELATYRIRVQTLPCAPMSPAYFEAVVLDEVL